MTAKEDRNLRDRLVFARVGWCRLYNETAGDEPLQGGSHNNDEVGSEFANFSVVKGRVYGYVRLGYDGQVVRVMGSPDAEVDDVPIALFATVYVWPGSAKDAILLPVRERRLTIPKGKGGTGQANVTYSRNAVGRLRNVPWISEVRRFIQSYDGPSLVGLRNVQSNEEIVADEAEALLRGQNIMQNAQMRASIEDYAMRKVRAALRNDGYEEVEDVHDWQSFDFWCRVLFSQSAVRRYTHSRHSVDRYRKLRHGKIAQNDGRTADVVA